MPDLPRESGFDHTLALAREGYAFISNRCERLGSDIFETRLMLRRAICLRGAGAAELFYAGDRFTRVGAMPVTVLKLLQDYGSVQLLDDAAHRHHKRMFLSVGTPAQAARLARHFEQEWNGRAGTWRDAQRIVLFDEVRPVLTRAVAAWAGIPITDKEAALRTREFSEMIEAAGSVGPRNWRALLLRARSERWARRVIAAVRSGAIDAAEDAPVRIVASHRDPDGRELDVKVAAVELLNVLRAVVAVARFIVFAAKALHEHPDARSRLAADNDELENFVQEVRRLSPFFPFIGGRVRKGFEWRGYAFAPQAWVLLDLYGTNRDPRTWEEPNVFRQERFRAKTPTPFELVPQGAGDTALTHRCPGEHLTVHLMRAAVRLLAAMDYDVPEQDLTVDLARIPALPQSGFVIVPRARR